MATTFSKLFVPTVLPAAVGVIFTMPTLPTTSILKNGRIRFANTTAGPVAVTAYADVAANPSAAGNCFMNAKSVPANDFIDVDIPTMVAGDTLRAFAAAASITAHEMGGILQS